MQLETELKETMRTKVQLEKKNLNKNPRLNWKKRGMRRLEICN